VKEYCLTPIRVEGRDDFAWVRASFSVTLEPEPGKIVPMKGKGILVLRKQSDGSWLCATDIWNFDEAVTTS
jgi:ketosteroid isomerase-like protein